MQQVKSQEKKERVVIYIPEELARLIRKRAYIENKSVSLIINEILKREVKL